MRSILKFIRTGNRIQSLGLITIGLAMLVGSNLAELEIDEWATREVVQVCVILIGIAATAFLFRRNNRYEHREREE